MACKCKESNLFTHQLICVAGPENFLLYADLNTIQLVSLDKDTEATPHILLYDDVTSNFVALTYDETTDTIYWSDLTRSETEQAKDCETAGVIVTIYVLL